MKKICPYCGRIDELGNSCKGCGYVLQASDKDAPEDVQQDKERQDKEQQEAVFQKYVYEEFVFKDTDAAPPPKNVVKRSELKFPDETKKAKNNSILLKLIRLMWSIFGISLLVFGISGFFTTLSFYSTGDIINGLVGTSVAVVISIGGLSCIQAFRKSRFWKYAKYTMIAALFITIGTTLFQVIRS